MSTPLAQHTPASSPPPAEAAADGALAQDTSGRPGSFGLNVKRLRLVRLIVLGLLSPLLIALTLLMIRFVSMPVTQARHLGAYEAGDYPVAIERLAPVERVNWFEPYLPHLSRGTALLQQGEDAAAEEELRVALEEWNTHKDLNSPLHAQCKILNNLAISIERQADLLEDPQQRADRLFEAEEMLAACAGGGGGGEGEGEGGGGEGQGGGGSGNEDSETTEGNGERIEEKRKQADEEAGNDPAARGEDEQGGEGEEPGEDPTAQDPGDPKREDPEGDGPEEEKPTSGSSEDQKDDELENRNRDAQGGDGEQDDGGTSDDPAKPW